MAISTSWEPMKPARARKALSMNPYEWSPTPSMFTPNHDKLVITFPKIAIAMMPFSRT